MGFKSYCWSIGTTSFRVEQLNYKNECQLRYLNELFSQTIGVGNVGSHPVTWKLVLDIGKQIIVHAEF